MISHTLVAVVLLLQSAQDVRPFLGVSTTYVDGPIEVEGRTFQHGLRIDFVTPDSGAAAAGLQAWDIIVEVAGVDFDVSQKKLIEAFQQAIVTRDVGDRLPLKVYRRWLEQTARIGNESIDADRAFADPGAAIVDKPEGTELHLVAEWVEELVAVEPVLGVRPTQNPQTRPIPPNEKIIPEPVTGLPEAELAGKLIDHFQARDDYEVLRKRLAKLVTEGDPFRLKRAAYALRKPFAMPELSRRMAACPRELADLLRHAAQQLDLEITPPAVPQLDTGLTPQQHAEQIEKLLVQANLSYEQAFAELSDDDFEFLHYHLDDVADSFREVVMVLVDPDRERLENVRKYVQIMARVDLGRLVESAMLLTALLDETYLTGLKADLTGHGAGIITRHASPLGPIVLSGAGSTWYREHTTVIIDIGGDDRYTHRTSIPFNLVIDLGGRDNYSATFAQAQAGVNLGVSCLYDADGDDTYIAQEWGQAAAAIGVGILWDRSGNDAYRAADYGQGAALCGVGLLIDDAGDDRYHAARYAQALGMPGGFGALLDYAGNDHYYVGGRDPTNYGTDGVFDAFGQGCGIGFRGLASGGLAVLRDTDGDDVYEGHNFAQGGGYYFGWGALVDDAGDDRYLGTRYAQAYAAHQALGFLEDHAGDDFYECWRDVGQSCSWDETVTALLDHAGNDRYSGGGFALCASHNNGWALFIDYAGRDRYDRFRGVPRADGNDRVTSFSLQLDFGGSDDHYPKNGHNNVVRHGNRNGFFGDFKGGLEDALDTYESQIAQ